VPDKRLFGSAWWADGYKRGVLREQKYIGSKPAANINMGYLQRIWENVTEDSDQYFVNGKLPFEQWSGDKGYIKLGLFNDQVDRKYTRDLFSNFGDNTGETSNEDFDEFFSDIFPDQDHPITASTMDSDYDGEQNISAWYYMVDLPVCPFFKVIGGARYERTEISTVMHPEPDTTWVPPGENVNYQLHSHDADVDLEQNDVLPSIGFEFTPLESLSLRASYSETIARPTFKELAPVPNSKYLGDDVFYGNPELQMSSIQNYDLRLDYTPFEGSLVSFSYFYKDVTDPIEYQQNLVSSEVMLTAENFPEGKLKGYEVEIRQQLGRFWDSLEGLAVGANATFMNSEVTISDKTQSTLALNDYPQTTRDMRGMPDYLYNLNLTYDIEKTGTRLGLFYMFQGETLEAGATQSKGNYVQSVYAKEYGTLNFSLSQKIGEHWTLGFKAKNLTNPKIETVYHADQYVDEDKTKTSYSKGIEYSINVSYEF